MRCLENTPEYNNSRGLDGVCSKALAASECKYLRKNDAPGDRRAPIIDARNQPTRIITLNYYSLARYF